MSELTWIRTRSEGLKQKRKSLFGSTSPTFKETKGDKTTSVTLLFTHKSSSYYYDRNSLNGVHVYSSIYSSPGSGPVFCPRVTLRYTSSLQLHSLHFTRFPSRRTVAPHPLCPPYQSSRPPQGLYTQTGLLLYVRSRWRRKGKLNRSMFCESVSPFLRTTHHTTWILMTGGRPLPHPSNLQIVHSKSQESSRIVRDHNSGIPYSFLYSCTSTFGGRPSTPSP